MISSDALIVPVSQLQTQQVMTSQIRSHRIFSTGLYYSAHFVVEIDEKSSLNGGFLYDLMMFRDSGLLFWATLYEKSYNLVHFGRKMVLNAVHNAFFNSGNAVHMRSPSK